MDKKITSCRIEAERWVNSIYATYDDGSTGKVLEYYPDEISFTEDELVGLTESQAREMKRLKDIAFLRS